MSPHGNVNGQHSFRITRAGVRPIRIQSGWFVTEVCGKTLDQIMHMEATLITFWLSCEVEI